MVVPNNHRFSGFPTKNDHFGVFGGYHHLRKHPYDLETYPAPETNSLPPATLGLKLR